MREIRIRLQKTGGSGVGIGCSEKTKAEKKGYVRIPNPVFDGYMETYDVIVIGGGPAGCMSAIKAGGRGKEVLLLEKNPQIGKKLYLTGNRRGNLTNLEEIDEFLKKYKNGSFLRNVFARFFNTDLVEFFEENGLPLKVERGNRVYPESDNAADIVKTLSKLLKKCRVNVLPGHTVSGVTPAKGLFEAVAGKRKFSGRNVVIACGGKSFPGTGSDGSGFIIAKKMGHTVEKLLPALCGIEIYDRNCAGAWSGVSLKNVRIAALLDGKKIDEEFGEVLFTHYGLSGPAVLNLSGAVSEIIGRGEVTVSLNLKPALSAEKLDARLCREMLDNSNKHLKNIFKNLMPERLISGFLKYAEIDGEKRANQVTREERTRIGGALSNLAFRVRNTRPFTDSMVTRGGISIKEINPRTMESKIVPGLFFAGEVIDVDGKTGGYNLQAAFTTGWAVGMSVR